MHPQPIAFELLPHTCPGGKAILGSKLPVRIHNRHDFVSLEGLELVWDVLLDGVPAAKGPLALPACAAGQSVEVTLEVKEEEGMGAAAQRELAGMLALLPAGMPASSRAAGAAAQRELAGMLTAVDRILTDKRREMADAIQQVNRLRPHALVAEGLMH
jgi:hypothetical protein